KCYGDQYLLIDARPGPAGRRLAEMDDLERSRRQVAEFERSVSESLEGWRTFLTHARRKGEKVVLWGSGSKAVAFLTTLGIDEEVTCVTDVNPYRHGMFVPGSGHEIVPPKELRSIRPDRVVVMNPIYLDEIRADLASMGLSPHVSAVGITDSPAREGVRSD